MSGGEINHKHNDVGRDGFKTEDTLFFLRLLCYGREVKAFIAQ